MSLNLDPSAPSTGLGGDNYALVSSGGAEYVIWRDHKLQIGDPTVAVALGVTNADPIPAPAAWVDQLPSGGNLSTPKIPGVGEDGPTVAGHTYPVGQLFAQSGTDQRFVLRRNGLAAVDQTAFVLLQGISASPISLDAAEVASAPRSDDKSLTTLLPAFGTAKYLDPNGLVLCVRQAPTLDKTIFSSAVLTDQVHAAVRPDGKGGVNVKPGTGALVYPYPSADTSTPLPFLIADDGISYQVADSDTLAALKLSNSAATPFPKQLLAGIRSGPVLSRKAVDLDGGLPS
jgi:hypothetical protein